MTAPTALPAWADDLAGVADHVDYALVRRLRAAVAERLSGELVRLRARRSADIGSADQRMLGHSLISQAIGEHVAELTRGGHPAPSAAAEDALSRAVFAAIFGLGRLERLVNTPEIENIDVNGCDEVWVSYADGRRARAAAVADTDDELIEMIQAFAAYQGSSTREFSSAKPLLNLQLPDGSRLSAWMAVTPRPGLTIRRHRFTDITLEDLVALGTLDLALAGFLRAAVRARRNIVVTGAVNSGKTTLIRALANAVAPVRRWRPGGDRGE